MPRTADHDARRQQIAGAAVRVVAGSGLDAATVARVAAEADMSVGLVQHYFATKDDLLLFAYEQVMTEVGGRVAVRIAEGEAQRTTISAVVFASLKELLPLDGPRRAEYRVAHAFRGRALDNPALAEVSRRTTANILAQLTTAVRNGTECGEVEPGIDAELAAMQMMALVEGLAGQLYDDADRRLGGRTLPDAAEELLRSCLDSVFTGECRHYG